jgi:hypothetical protein
MTVVSARPALGRGVRFVPPCARSVSIAHSGLAFAREEVPRSAKGRRAGWPVDGRGAARALQHSLASAPHAVGDASEEMAE